METIVRTLGGIALCPTDRQTDSRTDRQTVDGQTDRQQAGQPVFLSGNVANLRYPKTARFNPKNKRGTHTIKLSW